MASIGTDLARRRLLRLLRLLRRWGRGGGALLVATWFKATLEAALEAAWVEATLVGGAGGGF